tara:strand:+ start:1103 stop:1963 length:861 start_codon:yes stop_codon:yes gene_type:complete
MKKAISFSLYDSGYYYGGTHMRYTYNMVANILIAQKIFPDWQIYVYYDNTVKPNIINFLKKSPNVVAKDMTDHWLSKKDKIMWRNLAMDEDIDIVCIRDCDNWLSYREKVIMDDWIASDKNMHIIRDHCWHADHRMNAGLWGRKKQLNFNMENLMKEHFNNNKHHRTHSGDDEYFLINNFYKKYYDTTAVYIGEQYNRSGKFLPRGHHPDEPDIRVINNLINYNDFVNDRSKTEVVPGLNLIEASYMNEFHCGWCRKRLHVYIGDMFNKIPQKSIKVIEDNLKLNN